LNLAALEKQLLLSNLVAPVKTQLQWGLVDRPRLSQHLHVHLEADHDFPERGLISFTSKNRQVRIGSRDAKSLFNLVIPMLDGTLTLRQVVEGVGSGVAPEIVQEFVDALHHKQLLYDIGNDAPNSRDLEQFEGQYPFLQELQLDPFLSMRRLRASKIAIVGLQGPGAIAAMSLCAAGIGNLRLCDWESVSRYDVQFGTHYSPANFGQERCEALASNANSAFPQVRATGIALSDREYASLDTALAGSDLLISCVPHLESEFYATLNRVCFDQGLQWITCSIGALEGTVGPTFKPPSGPCYSCYVARSINGIEGAQYLPETLRLSKYISPNKSEASVFGHGVIGNLVALEAVRFLLQNDANRNEGSVAFVDFMTLESRIHIVLRQPWCPVCGQT
jgi:bacteriocin biosynthesis cyclodehydratase domain-containing protein